MENPGRTTFMMENPGRTTFIIQRGQAAVYGHYRSDARYTQAERAARGARLAIWQQPGEHQRPWEYRR